MPRWRKVAGAPAPAADPDGADGADAPAPPPTAAHEAPEASSALGQPSAEEGEEQEPEESAEAAARRDRLARELCAGGGGGGGEGGAARRGRHGDGSAGRLGGAAVREWLALIDISEPARDSFVRRGTDGAALGEIRKKLAGPPRRCAAQLEELSAVHQLRTLGERCRFVAALDELFMA